MRKRLGLTLWLAGSILFAVPMGACAAGLERVGVSDDGRRFVLEPSGRPFKIWGFNYDHDTDGRLIEDYWVDEWPSVGKHMRDMKALGANAARVHLQLGKFMRSPDEPDAASLDRLARLVRLAGDTGIYLNLTGLGCYHKKDVPPWYDALAEADRWAVQARFWEAVAKTCAGHPAVFCYDLMNEPILPGKEPATDWLAGEFGGKHFVQRVSLDLAGRTREEVGRAWVDRLVAAIRTHDTETLITIGVIPWAMVWPNAKPVFHGPDIGANLDFVSVHFYPEKGKVDKALKALAVYDVGKPLVIEEIFPLKSGIEDLDAFIEGARGMADGWFGFYWGRTPEEYAAGPVDLAGAITKSWLEYFRDKAASMKEPLP